MQEKYLSRREASAFLVERGLPVSRSGLQKMAVFGGGPEYQIFGNKAVYLPSKLIEWAMAKLHAPRRSTSEAA